MASNLIEMASHPIAMASNLVTEGRKNKLRKQRNLFGFFVSTFGFFLPVFLGLPFLLPFLSQHARALCCVPFISPILPAMGQGDQDL